MRAKREVGLDVARRRSAGSCNLCGQTSSVWEWRWARSDGGDGGEMTESRDWAHSIGGLGKWIVSGRRCGESKEGQGGGVVVTKAEVGLIGSRSERPRCWAREGRQVTQSTCVRVGGQACRQRVGCGVYRCCCYGGGGGCDDGCFDIGCVVLTVVGEGKLGRRRNWLDTCMLLHVLLHICHVYVGLQISGRSTSCLMYRPCIPQPAATLPSHDRVYPTCIYQALDTIYGLPLQI